MEKPKAPPSTCPDPECDGKHSAVAKCPKCGACLYAHAKQVHDPDFPLFECGKCGHRVFWD